MAQEALGILETRGLVALVEAADTMLKAANVHLMGSQQVGSGYISAFVTGDVAAVRAAVDAGTNAVKALGGELISTHVIPRPHEEGGPMVPKP